MDLGYFEGDNQVFDEMTPRYNPESIHDNAEYPTDDSYDKLHFLVHPGWAPNNYEKDWEKNDRKDLLLQNFYSEYMHELSEVFDETGPREPLHVIYSEGSKSHAETIIEQLGGAEINGYTRSKKDSGELPDENFEEVLETIQEVHPDGEITVHGEIKGRCSSVFQRQIAGNDTHDVEINEGVTFPPEPSWNYVFTTNTCNK